MNLHKFFMSINPLNMDCIYTVAVNKKLTLRLRFYDHRTVVRRAVKR